MPFQRSSSRKLPFPRWYERILAMIILVNFCLIIFDITYLPLRDFWLQGRVQFTVKVGPFEQEFPKPPLRILPFSIAPYYDWVKGIEGNRTTDAYLRLVDQLNTRIDEKALEGYADPAKPVEPSSQNEANEVREGLPDFAQLGDKNAELNPKQPILEDENAEIPDILADLREASREMIVQNPFQIANKTGTLERIKNKMRTHVFDDKEASATKAFEEFWSEEYLLKNGSSEQFRFFDAEIRPLMESNYFRAIGENGLPFDNFPLLDFPFVSLFLLDFLVRTKLISRRYKSVSWRDAMLWRWYDFFLFFPVLRWLRIIPLTVRLDQAELIDYQKIKSQATQGFVALIAEEMTQVIVVRVVDQLQDTVKSGQIRTALEGRNKTEYIDINNRNEAAEIFRIISQILVTKVMPQAQPEVRQFLMYNIDSSLDQNTGYQQMQRLPGFKSMQSQMMETAIDKTYEQVVVILTDLLKEDKEFDRLLEELVNKFMDSLNSELKLKNNLDDMEGLLVDFFEEFKINYVQQIPKADIDQILDETRSLRQK